jgi:nucleoside-diphosphate-sugar epimerase
MLPNKKTFAVTGASGLVGSACAKYLRSQGHRVLALQRKIGEGAVPFTLGQTVDPELLRGVDSLIHCAYDFRAFGWEEVNAVNVQGSILLFEAALRAGVKKIVFVSSVSAFPGCRSVYGKGKLAVEEFVLEKGGSVVRPGLVYGDDSKGMFGSLCKMVQLPVLPVFGGGYQEMFLVHVEDLAKSIAALAESPEGGLVTLANPQPILFREIILEIAKRRGKRVLLVPFPSGLALLAFRFLELVGLRLNFRSDNLLGLVHTNPSYDFSPLKRLGLSLRPFRN